MADIATLSFAVVEVTSTQLDVLVKNTGADALNKAVLIEVKIPLYLVSKTVSDAVERARQRNLDERTTASKESLANVVTGPKGWSAWATTERTDSLAVIRFVNDFNQTGEKVSTPTSFAASTSFNLRIPLKPQEQPYHVEIPYSYRYPNEGRSGRQTDGELEVKSSGTKITPKVTLTVDHPNPTQIKPETKVRISWEIENGVSATLYGPLPNGNSQISLNPRETGTYKMRKDSLEIYAVGTATYILQAEVRGANANENEMVIRTLYLGIQSANDYSYLAVRPKRVMPHGVLEVDWAVWGIEKTWLSVGNDYEIELNLTEQGISQAYQGSGVWRVVAPETEGTVTALLQSQVHNQRKDEKADNFVVAAWRAKDISISGTPVGVAFAAPKMAVITSNSFWLAEVGVSDGSSTDLDFKRISNGTPKARLAIAAVDGGFVVLEQTSNDGLQLVRYSLNGQRDGLPIDLPDTIKPLVRMAGKTFDLAVLGERVYVAIEGVDAGGFRRVFSVTFKPQVKFQPEPLLEAFRGFRLVVFDNALFALSQGTGHMFRFRQDSKGNLERPMETARAAKDGRSMIFRGLIVPLGRVLLVLGPSSIPQIESLDVEGLLKYSFVKRPTGNLTQDLVYNPQQDHWMPCGRGLRIQSGSVAAFRATASKRLWVVESDKKAHTLSGAIEHLFSPEFVADFPSKELRPYFGKRVYKIKNDTDIAFGPMSEVYRKAGLDDFTAWGPAEPLNVPKDLDKHTVTTVEFSCNEKEPAPITLRYMAYVAKGCAHDYMLEIEFQGPGHSLIKSVLKRLAVDEQGQVSVAEIPGTLVQHTPGATIVLPPAKLLTAGVKLNVTSLSGYIFGVRHRLEPIKSDFSNEYRISHPLQINYDTPAFTIFVAGAGELRFDVDFALPPGIEISSRNITQTKLMRIDAGKAGVLAVDSASYNGTDQYDCGIRYRHTENLDNICIGSGEVTSDGSALYLPLMSASNLSAAQVCQVDVPSLVITGGINTQANGFSIFAVPNSVGLLKDRNVSMFGLNTIFLRDKLLQEKQRFTLNGPTAVVGMATSESQSKIGLLCLKEERVNQNVKYSYSYSRKRVVDDKLIDEIDYSLDEVQGISTQNRVPGAPAWVSANYVSPFALSPDGDTAAIGIEGGLILIKTRPRQDIEVKVIPIPGAERAEAITVDSYDEILCAHSQQNRRGLLVSYYRPGFEELKMITLPDVAIPTITDARPLKTPALQYKQHRAVSLLRVAASGLCVSCGKTIYAINTNQMVLKSSVDVDLPCRLVRAKIERPPYDMKYGGVGGAAPCHIVLAIGAFAASDGTTAENVKTKLYKLGFD